MSDERKVSYVKKHIGTEKLFDTFLKNNETTKQEQEKLQWGFEELSKTTINHMFIIEAYNIIHRKIKQQQEINTDKNVPEVLGTEEKNKTFFSIFKSLTNKWLLISLLIAVLVLITINYFAYRNLENVSEIEEKVQQSKLVLQDGISYSPNTKKPFRGQALSHCENEKYSKKYSYYVDGKIFCEESECSSGELHSSGTCTEALIETSIFLPKENARARLYLLDWLNKIVVLIFAVLFILNIRKKEKEIILFELPNHFLMLSPDMREQALNYAWNTSKKLSDNVPRLKTISTTLTRISLIVVMAILGIFSLMTFISGHSVVWSISIFIFVLLLYLYNRIKSESDFNLEQDELEREMRNGLVSLVVGFTNENIKFWIEEIEKKYIENSTLEVADIQPEKTYILYSFNLEILASNLMPSKSLNLTCIFLEKYITVISGIEIDIKKITYSFINKDEPSYFVNSKNDWSSEEFHYQDIVEIGYKSIENSVRKVDSIKVENAESDQQGMLFISLVNSTNKEYPTAKKDIGNLFVDVRSRVRQSKVR